MSFVGADFVGGWGFVFRIRNNSRVEQCLALGLPVCPRLDISSFFQGVLGLGLGHEVVDAFEGAVGFAHLQDFFSGRWADAWDQLQLG
jgi:hypothetical protein